MKKFLMIAAMAMVATVACKGKDEPANKLDATIVAAPASVKINGAGTLTATLSANAENDVTISVANEKADVLTVGSEIKIAKGAKTGTLAFTGKAAGKTKLSFTSSSVNIKTASTEVTVTEGVEPPATYEFPVFEWGTYSAVAKIIVGSTTIVSSAADAPQGTNKPLAGNDDFEVGYVSDDKTSTIVPITDGIAYTIFYSNFTANEAATEMAVALYFDWNNDGKFDGAGEEIKVEKGIMANANKEISGTITIPSNAVASSRARVMCYFVSGSSIKHGVGDSESGNLIDFTYSK